MAVKEIRFFSRMCALVLTCALTILFGAPVFRAGAQSVPLAPDKMPRIGAVDERFQSYNVEMIEVTGGRFWKPYARIPKAAPPPQASAGGAPPDLYEYRPPTDLTNARLRRLAAALGPVYIRVSGTWANSVYFHDSDDPAPQTPPAGFNSVLTRKQWKSVIDFASAANGKLITSFAWSPGTRDAAGVWTPEQARRLLAYTKAAGGSIAGGQFVNEPNFAANGGAPKGYDAAAFARDLAVFRQFFREAAPGSLFLGPDSVGEGGVLGSAPVAGRLKTEDLLKGTGAIFDVFAYHNYAAAALRCMRGMSALGGTADAARSQDWLFRPDKVDAYYADLRDRYNPGKPLWVTETADAVCGGNPWASTFLDTFRYLNQHGRLARRGVQVIVHNTLAASDYGLLDETTFDPRPNYWAAVLWRRLMGLVVLNTGVLNADAPAANDLHTYAHCHANRPGGVTVLAINAGTNEQEIDIPLNAERYTLSATQAASTVIQLNGQTLQAGRDGSLPNMTGVAVKPSKVKLAPASISFLVFPQAGNKACR